MEDKEEYEDLKKIDEIIKKHKLEAQDTDEIEFPEFIDYDCPNEADDAFEFEDYEIPNFTKADITKFHSYAPTQFLSSTEKGVVDSCTDPVLKELLLLNRTKNIQLIQMYRNIKDLLVECQANITENEEKIKAFKQTRKVASRIWRQGIPYFKTVDDFPCPRNADVIKKHINGEMFYYDMTPSFRWSERDVNRLLEAVAFQYKKHKELQLEDQIIHSQKNGQEHNVVEFNNKLMFLRKSDTNTDYPPLNYERLNWSRISELFFNDKYSARDCQVFWTTYLHPDINKSPWSEEENEKVKSLVLANNHQNWDQIAQDLGTDRTGFITCVHYYSRINSPCNSGRFSPEEDKQLCDLVEKYRQGESIPWTRIARHFSGRTRAQLFYRYKYFLSCREGTLKGKFSKAEDILILVLVDRFGKKFTKCAEYLPHRSVVQIKARYTSNLKGAIKKGSFTIEEDQKILDYVEKNGTKNWEPLVKMLNRCGGQIRQRHNTLASFQRANPGVDLDNAPRRRYFGISFNDEYAYLRLMADEFKSYEKIPTVEEIQKLLESKPKPKPKPLKKLIKTKGSGRERGLDSSSASTEAPKRRCYSRAARGTLLHNDKEDVTNEPVEEKSELIRVTESNIKRDLPASFEDRPLPSLAIDDLITDFYSNEIKLNFEQNLKKELICRATSTLNSILSVLQAELHIPENFKENPQLDAIDRDILDILKEDKPITINGEYVLKGRRLAIGRIIPPNLNTIVGMRGFLIKNHVYKAKCAKRSHSSDFSKELMEKQVLWRINNHLSNQPKAIRNRIIIERKTFFRRFVSLFKFPAIMSLVEPSNALQMTTNQKSSYAVRTYQKKPKINPTQTNPTRPTPFETVFIKEPERNVMDYEIETTTEYVSNGNQAEHFFINTINDPNEVVTITKAPRQMSGGKEKFTDRVRTKSKKIVPNSTISVQLKRKIEQTIHELTQRPSTKKFFHSTDIVKPEKDSPDELAEEIIDDDDGDNSRTSIATVIGNNIISIPKSNNNKGRARKEKHAEKVSVVSVVPQVPQVSVPSAAQAQIIGTYYYTPRTNRTKTSNDASNNRNKILSSSIKSENVCSGEAQSSFNNNKGRARKEKHAEKVSVVSVVPQVPQVSVPSAAQAQIIRTYYYHPPRTNRTKTSDDASNNRNKILSPSIKSENVCSGEAQSNFNNKGRAPKEKHAKEVPLVSVLSVVPQVSVPSAAQAQIIRTYAPRTNSRTKTSKDASKPAVSSNNNRNKILPSSIKSENVCSGEAQSNFNLGKGELILEINDLPSAQTSTTTYQDLQDLKLLDEILKQERNAVEETFDF